MAKSVLDGTDLILSMGGNALGFSTGCKVSTSAETGERVTKEASGGKWKESYVKSFSEQISADGVVLTDGGIFLVAQFDFHYIHKPILCQPLR